MSTSAARQAARIPQLLDQVMAAAAEWAQAEYETGIDIGRIGVVPEHAKLRRALAEAKFRDVAARLSAAMAAPSSDSGQESYGSAADR